MFSLINCKLLFITLTCALTSSANSAMKSNQKDINTNIVNLYEKFEYLDDKMEVNEVQSNRTNRMLIAIIELQQIQDNRTGQIMELQTKFQQIQDNKTDKILELLSEIVAHQKKSSIEVKSELELALSSECSSMCSTWANHTTLSLGHCLDTLTPLTMDSSTSTPDRKLSSVCDPNPCQHGGRCEVTGSGYSCEDCPYPTTGSNCERVTCNNNKCFIHNKVYYEFIDVKANWDDADRKCQERGMTLAMMKNKETSDFLLTKARSLYSARSHYFWVGLKFSAKEKGWRWVDGSRLEVYTEEYEDYFGTYNEGQCCLMFISEGNVFCDPKRCTLVRNSICEKRFPTA